MALSMRLGAPRTGPRHDERARDLSRAAAHGSLPTGRALVGGLLVALSALGIFQAHRAATADHRAAYLILTRSVPAGGRITASDLALAPMDLYETTRRRALTDPDAVIGRVAIVPLRDGDLVLASATAASVDAAATPARRVGLALDAADALGGGVAVGDRVDVVAVPRAEDPAEIIVRGALVTTVGGSTDATVGSAEHVQVTLDVASEEDARRVIESHARGGVTLIAASTLAVAAPATEPTR